DFGHDLVGESAVERILHHAHDLKRIVRGFERRLFQSRNANHLPHRVATVQSPAHEALVDHGQSPPAAHFTLSKETSVNERYSEGLRVIGVDLMNHDRSRVLLRAAYDFYRRVEVSKRMHAGVQSNRLHAGHGAHSSQQFLEERDPALTIRITLLRQ